MIIIIIIIIIIITNNYRLNALYSSSHKFDVCGSVHLGNIYSDNINSDPTRCKLYSLFLSSSDLHVSGALCTQHLEYLLQRNNHSKPMAVRGSCTADDWCT
jgi:hypothetical protein